ncbi:MAG: LysR family transcriptional regulator [Lachnospiraceae bacterium]|nr:LysR family transcriptional regulator [Lachnospiraceae bacterium]
MSEINMRQIEVFLAVAKYENISKAAQALYTSQPSISNWIAKMEEYCGFKLFKRTNRGVVLTDEGEELYARLDIAYQRFRVSVNEFCETKIPAESRLRIGSLNRLDVVSCAEEQMKIFKDLHPDVSIWFERYNFHELRDKALCEELDLIFSVSSDIEPYSEFESAALRVFPAHFIVPNEWAAASPEEFDYSTLSGKTLIIEAPTQRAWAEKTCGCHGIVPSDVRYVNSYILMSTLVNRGEGFSVEGEMVTTGIYAPVNTFIPADNSYCPNVVAAWKKESTSEMTKLFIESIKSGK